MRKPSVFTGDIFVNKYGEEFIVTSYEGAKNVHIKFTKTGYETITATNHIHSGLIRDRLKPSLYGVGIIGSDLATIGGIRDATYSLWKDMFYRCYSKKGKNLSTYEDSEVAGNFIYYSFFKEWCLKQKGFGNKGWQLDKDILVKGNKIYSEDTCCFVPKEINMAFVKSNARRGKYPIGVHYREDRGKYVATLNNFNGNCFLGHFNTSEEAFVAYKLAKEQRIKMFADKYKDELEHRVYDVLVNYQVEITD